MSLQGVDAHVLGVAIRSASATGGATKDEVLGVERLRRGKQAGVEGKGFGNK